MAEERQESLAPHLGLTLPLEQHSSGVMGCYQAGKVKGHGKVRCSFCTPLTAELLLASASQRKLTNIYRAISPRTAVPDTPQAPGMKQHFLSQSISVTTALDPENCNQQSQEKGTPCCTRVQSSETTLDHPRILAELLHSLVLSVWTGQRHIILFFNPRHKQSRSCSSPGVPQPPFSQSRGDQSLRKSNTREGHSWPRVMQPKADLEKTLR